VGELRLLIEGIGGVGGVLAGELVRAGQAPVLITGNPEIAAAINRDGLRVTTPEADYMVRAEVFAALDQLPAERRFDAALLIMKAQGVVAAAQQTMPHLVDHGYVVTCQNGIVEDAVAEAIGAERVVSGIIGWGASMHAPGVYERTGPGKNHLGELEGGNTPRVEALGRILARAMPIELSANMRGALWSKLAINCMITTPCALTGQTLGEMLSTRRARLAALTIYREVIDTAEALGVKLEKIAVSPRLLYLPADAGALRRAGLDLLAKIIGRRYRKLRSSSLQSLERGRRTEIDFLNGHVVQRAGEVGVRVPMNASLVRMIHEIEAGERKMSPSNLDALLGALG